MNTISKTRKRRTNRLPDNNNKPWNQTEIKTLRLLSNFSVSDKKIGKILKRSDKSVSARKYMLGIKKSKEKNKGNGTAWTKEEDELLTLLIRLGIRYDQMVNIFNRTEAGIQNRSYIMGFHKYHGRGNMNIPTKKVTLGVKEIDIDKEKKSRKIKRWTEKEEEVLLELVEEGHKISSIADLFNRTPNAIHLRLGILRNRDSSKFEEKITSAEQKELDFEESINPSIDPYIPTEESDENHIDPTQDDNDLEVIRSQEESDDVINSEDNLANDDNNDLGIAFKTIIETAKKQNIKITITFEQ